MTQFLGYDISLPEFEIVTNRNTQRTQSGQQLGGGGTDKRYRWRFTIGPHPDSDVMLAMLMAHFNRMGFTNAFDWVPPQPPGIEHPGRFVVRGNKDARAVVPGTVPVGLFFNLRGRDEVYQVGHDHRAEPPLFVNAPLTKHIQHLSLIHI